MPRKVILHQQDVQVPENAPATDESPKQLPGGSAALSVSQARNTAQGYIAEIRHSQKYHEHNESAQKELEDLVHQLTSQPRQNGSPADFHNLTVLLAGGGFPELACLVLDVGLRCFPLNTDLLGDYLIYGIDCERLPQCREHFDTLQRIPKADWTWRSFSFSIAYLNRLKDITASVEERNALSKRIMQLARDYKKHLPFMEGGYREIAKLHSKSPEKELRLLNEALSNETLGACPACALQAADILFAQKKYQEALASIQRSLEDTNNQKQGGINESYLYFLSGLCKLALFTNGTLALEEENIIDVYTDFNASLVGLGSEYRNTVRTKVQLLEQRTFVKVPDEHEMLLALIGDQAL